MDAMDELAELDSLTVINIVDNESDSMTSPCNCCRPNSGSGVSHTREIENNIRRDGFFTINGLCFAGHGLSLLLVAERQGTKYHLLFDAGPDPELWRQNARKLDVNFARVEATVLSHYHIDHSGGYRGAVPEISAARKRDSLPALVVDLHDSGIVTRGFEFEKGNIVKMEPDNPTVEELTAMGARPVMHGLEHTLCNNSFYVSGNIPRKTSYEKGMPAHATLVDGVWQTDEAIADERYVACKVRGRGMVVFSACSHAGIINVCRDLKSKVGSVPLFGVVGGFHLAGSQVEGRIAQTVTDLKALEPTVVLAGHCTGWRAKVELSRVLGERFQPCSVGSKYVFSAECERDNSNLLCAECDKDNGETPLP